MAKQKNTRQKPERLSGIQNSKDRNEALETLIRAFGNVEFMENHMTASLWKGDFADPEDTRVAVQDGEVVSVVVMAPRNFRFGPVSVPAMTVGPVGTHNHHRHKGLSFAAMNDASEHMKQRGALIAYMGGIPNYYYRFGYYPYMAWSSVTFNRKEGEKHTAPATMRTMRKKDIPEVAALYEQAAAGRVGPAMRDEKLWNWLMTHGGKTWMFKNPRLIYDAEGKLCGYFTNMTDEKMEIKEIVIRQDEAACRAALGVLTKEAKRREVKEIHLPLPWDDQLAVYVRQFIGGTFKMSPNPTGGPLMKIVDFPALMQKLEPLFSERWKSGGAALGEVEFTLTTDGGSVSFSAADGKVTVGEAKRGGSRVNIPQRWFTGLLTGYHAVKFILNREDVKIPAKLVPALEVLFPAGWPFVHQADNY